MPNFILITQSYRINNSLQFQAHRNLAASHRGGRSTVARDDTHILQTSRFVTIVIHWLEELACNSLSMVSRACSPSVLLIGEIHLINRTR